MEPGSEEAKKFFAEIAKSYNDDIELENMHRDNLFRHIIACIVWIAASILGAWGIIDFGKDNPIWVTIAGVGIILTQIITLYSINMKHHRHVKHYLHARHCALLWKDGKLP